MRLQFSLLSPLLCLGALNAASATGWPQFLGPTRDGVYSGNDLAESWPKEGPPVVWKRKVGEGFSGPTVAENKAVLFHRIANNEVIECMDAGSGSVLWKHTYPTTYRDDFGFDNGPRATPSIVDGRIYSFGAEGSLRCVDLRSGKSIWTVDCKKQFAASKGFFGMVCSPLVEDEAVLVNVGGANGAGIVSFDRKTGKLLWKATDDEASYSSPITASIQNQRYGIFFTREKLVGLNPSSGVITFEFPWKPPMNASVSAATPLAIDDLIFISASYQTGAALLRVKAGRIDKVWSSDDVLSNHYATSVYHAGYLYGFHGRQEHGTSFRCVELQTGKVMWSDENLKAGTVTVAGPTLLLMLEDGQLILAPASPRNFRISARAQILPFEVRAHPAIANGHLFARSKDQLVCVSLN